MVIGAGVAQRLGVDIEDKLELLRVYTPKRHNRSPMESPFTTRFINPAGIFAIQQEFDQEYMLSSLDFARELFQYEKRFQRWKSDWIQQKCKNIKTAISKIMGDNFVVKDRFQQDEAFMRLMNIEKWMSYAIVCLTLLLVSFNMIGALWMIVLDKNGTSPYLSQSD